MAPAAAIRRPASAVGRATTLVPRRRSGVRAGRWWGSRSWGGGLVLTVLALVALASLAAPEQPVAQAGICERHNGADACRVW